MIENASRHVVILCLWTTACVLLIGCAEEKTTVTPHVTGTAEEMSPLLIAPQSLEDQLADVKLRILDVRPAAEYEKGHIPGAVHLDISAWKKLALSDGGLQDAKAWGNQVGSLGIAKTTSVVVYGGKLNNAARAWWLLKYVGLSDVRLLDGDWTVWQAADRPVETGAIEVAAVDFQPQLQSDRLAVTDDVKRYGDDPEVVILDARSKVDFQAGHVPGAVCLDWNELLTDDGRFKTPEQLRAIFEKVPVADSQTAVVYCQSGSRSSAEAFALELAGYPNVKNYFRSWQQFSREAQ